MCPWTPLSRAPHATQTKQPLAHLSLGGEGVWRPAGRQVEGTRRVRGRLQGQRGPAVPGSPACPILSWTPSRRCLQGQRWHIVVGGLTVDVGAARYLRAGRFIDLVPWKRHPDSLGPRPGRLGQVRQQGRGPCRGLTCGVRHPGWPRVSSSALCSPALPLQKPPSPPRPHTARQSSLLPARGLGSLGRPRHTHLRPWVPRPPFLWIIRSQTVHCYHASPWTMLYFPRQRAGGVP